MRYHDDPRWDISRLGQVEYNTGAYSKWLLGVVRRHKQEFRPYRWRDPARARAWAQLPPDLIELMQAEAAEDDEPPLEQPRLQPPARQGSGPPAGRGPLGGDRPPRADLREAGPGPWTS